jgi:hypothetical protein
MAVRVTSTSTKPFSSMGEMISSTPRPVGGVAPTPRTLEGQPRVEVPSEPGRMETTGFALQS